MAAILTVAFMFITIYLFYRNPMLMVFLQGLWWAGQPLPITTHRLPSLQTPRYCVPCIHRLLTWYHTPPLLRRAGIIKKIRQHRPPPSIAWCIHPTLCLSLHRGLWCILLPRQIVYNNALQRGKCLIPWPQRQKLALPFHMAIRPM